MRRLVCLCALLSTACAGALERFPRPDFESGYVRPATQTPLPRAEYWQAVDLVLLAAGLLAAVWLAHRKRRRGGVLLLAAGAVLYFGFWRAGCICPVGSVQNVALAAGGWGYALPLTALAFFLLPLIGALFFGRVFCSGVCPFGALQELVLLKPLRVPAGLDRLLRFGPWLLLGLTGVYAFTNTAFLICEHDPFVPFFRLSGPTEALLAAGAVLALSTVVGRPYCRYACPYGALLSLCARLSWKPVVITPHPCVNCHACAGACPYGAIRGPEAVAANGAGPEKKAVGWPRVALALLLPTLPFFGLWAGGRLADGVAERNPVIRQAGVVQLAAGGQRLDPGRQEMADAFLQTRADPNMLYEQAARAQRQIRIACMAAGGALGLLAWIGLLLLRPGRPVRWRGYEAAPEHCVACGRCFSACPRNRVLPALQKRAEPPAKTGDAAQVQNEEPR